MAQQNTLAKRRAAIGLTQVDLAERAEVGLRTLQQIESGLVAARRSTLAAIDRALHEAEWAYHKTHRRDSNV